MKPVVITTEFRGVFFGYLDHEPQNLPEHITLKNARCCVYWSSDVRGVLGLASNGPSDGCQIGPSVPEFVAWKITSIMECTPSAVEKWEQNIWGR